MAEHSAPESGQALSSVHAMFVGAIDQFAAKRISDGLALATGPGPIEVVHLAFQSSGGNVGDGVFIYNLFNSLPTRLIVYNIGGVYSIGTTAFLGAHERKASAHAAFMLHRTQLAAQTTTASRLESLAHSLSLDDERTEAIIRKNVTLSDEQWRTHEHSDLWFSAQDAKKAGIIHEIAEFFPPFGQKLYVL